MMNGLRLDSVTLLLGFALGVPARAAAQRAGMARGSVRDAASGQAVPNVLVTVMGRGLSDTTGADGRYEIRGVPSGPVSLQARRLGFVLAQSPTYTLFPDSVLLVDFALTPSPVSIEGVDVFGTPPVSRVAIGAQVLTSKDLPGRGNILSALQGVVPGVQASGRRDDVDMRARQSHASMLYVINGTVITPPLVFYIDTQDVQCVEVRRGYRAAQEFRPSINGQMYSGVILIWTKGSLAPQPKECAA